MGTSRSDTPNHDKIRSELRPLGPKHPKMEVNQGRADEERDREGYLRQPQSLDEVRLWEAEAAWLEE